MKGREERDLDRKREQFTENIQIANKHMEPSLTLLNLRKVYMCKILEILVS